MMVFKEKTTENNQIVENMVDTANNNFAKKKNHDNLPKVHSFVKKSASSSSSRLENGTFIMEPLKRTKSLRRLSMIAIIIFTLLLSGAVFQYGQLLILPGIFGATGGNFNQTRKVDGSSPKANDIVSEDTLISVTLTASSVEKDLNVRIIGEDNYPILGQRFRVEITTPEGEKTILTDNDRTGRFYIDGLESGEYSISMMPQEGYITPEPIEVEVLDKVQFVEIVNIADKIVNQKDVNSAAEDPQYNNSGNVDAGTPGVPEVVEVPSDTVELIDSKVVETKVSKFTANVDSDGRLFTKGGTLTDIVPIIVDGYLTPDGDYTMYEAPTETTPDPDPDNNEGNDEGGDIDLFEKDANGVYIYDITEYVETKLTYYGWQDIEGKRYYFDKNGKKVTGTQTIGGRDYSFNSEGVLVDSSTRMLGVDVSTWQNYIDWNKVKASGIDFVMIRAGFRGYGSGLLVEDDLFYTNLKNAKAAGLRVGVYFFSQAINEVEGVEEASMVVSLIRKYGISLDYPIAFDSEYSGAAGNNGRADRLSRSERTAVAVAFCETVRNAGYSAMVYASKSWFETNLSTSAFSNYYIWLAHYTSGGAPSSYSGRYEMWQYTSQGSVNGIAGNVDMNYGYMGY